MTAWRSTAFQAAFRSPPANQLTSPCFISPTKASSGGRTQSRSPASRSQKRRGLSRLSTAEPPARLEPLLQTAFDELLLTRENDRGRQAIRQPALHVSLGTSVPPRRVVPEQGVTERNGGAQSPATGSGARRRASRAQAGSLLRGIPSRARFSQSALRQMPSRRAISVSDRCPWCSRTKRRKYSVSAPEPPGLVALQAGRASRTRPVDGQEIRGELPSVAEDDRPLDGVLQLADVPRPGVFEDRLAGLGGELQGRLVEAAAGLPQQEVRELEHVRPRARGAAAG